MSEKKIVAEFTKAKLDTLLEKSSLDTLLEISSLDMYKALIADALSLYEHLLNRYNAYLAGDGEPIVKLADLFTTREITAREDDGTPPHQEP